MAKWPLVHSTASVYFGVLVSAPDSDLFAVRRPARGVASGLSSHGRLLVALPRGSGGSRASPGPCRPGPAPGPGGGQACRHITGPDGYVVGPHSSSSCSGPLGRPLVSGRWASVLTVTGTELGTWRRVFRVPSPAGRSGRMPNGRPRQRPGVAAENDSVMPCQ